MNIPHQIYDLAIECCQTMVDEVKGLLTDPQYTEKFKFSYNTFQERIDRTQSEINDLRQQSECADWEADDGWYLAGAACTRAWKTFSLRDMARGSCGIK